MHVSTVPYINSMPYVHLFEQKSTSRYSLSLDPPIRGVEKFAAGEVDAALLPVAALRSLSRPFKRVPFGIASVGQVRSVLLLSQCEVHEIEELFLDYQSVTSVQLLRVLMRSHWQCTAELLPASVGYETEICGARGGLVIGDRALQHSRCFDHVYDLEIHLNFLIHIDLVYRLHIFHQHNISSTQLQVLYYNLSF